TMQTRIYCHRWNNLRAQPCETAQVVSGYTFDGKQQEGYQRTPTASHAESHLQNGMVHGAPAARSNAGIASEHALGGEEKIVEIDETYIGGKEKNKHRNKRNKLGTGGVGKEIAFSLVERGGHVRSHHVPTVSARTLRPILEQQIHAATNIMSDDGGSRVAAE